MWKLCFLDQSGSLVSINVVAGMEMVTILKVFCYVEVKQQINVVQVYIEMFM